MESLSRNKLEFEFFGLAVFLLRRWKTIALATLAFAVAGTTYALLAKPVYTSDAVITPREQASGGGNSFVSQLGGLGGAFAAQFGGTNATLDRLQVMIGSREIAETVIRKHDLLPRLYPEEWDWNAHTWKKGPPNLRLAVEALRSGSITSSVESRKKLITVSSFAGDSTLAADLVRYYLDAMNTKIQDDTRADADANRQYLESQLALTQDPLLRERIQGLMTAEVERYMLVNVRAFDILQNPAVPLRKLKPKRGQIVAISILMGIVLSCVGLISAQILRDRRREA